MMEPFTYARAGDVQDALKRFGERTALLAGGTELLNWMRLGIEHPAHIVDISRLQDLKGIESIPGGSGLRIGALATLNEVALNPRVANDFPALSEACLKAASAQLRNLASIGGNLLQRTRCPYFRSDEVLPCNRRVPGSGCAARHGINEKHAIFGWTDDCVAVQPSDPAVALSALEADIVIESPRGTRRVSAADFHTLPADDRGIRKHNVMDDDELITSIELPCAMPNSAYLKVRERESYEFAIASAAVGLDKYKNLTKEQQEQLDEQVEDSEAVDYEKEQVSRQVFNKDTDKAILRNLMENGIRNADGTRLGKSIVFARNHAHAKLLVELFDEMYPQYGGDFCVRIDNYEPRAEQLIDDFKTTDGSKNLTIAVSVDMLDTGIDVPSIVNLVFAKPVKSYAKFWQMIGRGTRLCENLFGPGKDKSEFRIFDHWGNFEYFDELKEEADPSRSKSLPEQLFEARIILGETGIEKQELPAFQMATKLLAADIAALPEDCLSVREKWKDIRGMQKDGILDGFSAPTVAALRSTIAPLMQWRDCAGKEAALRFDLLVTRLLTARLSGSADAEGLRDQLIDQICDLPINLKPVQEKLPIIQKAKQTKFHETATVTDLETLRQELRGVMRYRKSGGTERAKPLYLNVAEDEAEYKVNVHKVKLAGMDLAAYRSRVESVLKGLFEQSTALQKIRAGEPVAESDLEELVSDVLLQDPGLRLQDLLEHYPNKSQNLALAIRRIVGMDAAKVDEHLKAFVQQYPGLNSNQIRFLELLKAHVSTYGSIELEKLWENPFTTLHAEGIDGVFPDSVQVDSLLDLLQDLNESAA